MLALLGTEFQKKQRALRRLKKKKRELRHKGHLRLICKEVIRRERGREDPLCWKIINHEEELLVK